MTRSYSLIHELIQLVEKQEEENQNRDLSLADFSGFLNQHVRSVNQSAHDELAGPLGSIDKSALAIANQLDNNISRLIIFLNRYARFYIKKALEETPLLTVEEFTCLGILLTHDHLSQSELIMRNVQEKTSGVQVIKRLIAIGLAKQWDNPDDKRGKLIALTDEGKELIKLVLNDIAQVSKVVTGSLNDSEKQTFLFLLKKLEAFHFQLYDNKQMKDKADLDTIMDSLTIKE